MTGQKESPMQAWPVPDVKARFSEFLDACIAERPQHVTRRGADAAALVPIEQWRRLQSDARPSLERLLMLDSGRAEWNVPARGAAGRRQPLAVK